MKRGMAFCFAPNFGRLGAIREHPEADAALRHGVGAIGWEEVCSVRARRRETRHPIHGLLWGDDVW